MAMVSFQFKIGCRDLFQKREAMRIVSCLLFLIATLFRGIDSAEASSRHPNGVHHCRYRKYPFPEHHSGLPHLADVLVGDNGTAVYFIAVNLGACFQEWKHAHDFHSDDYNHHFICSFPDGEAVLSNKIPQKGPLVFAQSLVTIRCSIPAKYQHLTRKPSLYPGFNVSLYATEDLESENGKPSEAGLPLGVYRNIPVCNPEWPLPNNTVTSSQKKYKLSIFTRLVSSYRATLSNETLYVNPEQVIAWVEYHLRIGFEHVFIYDNNEEEHGPFEDLFRPYIDAGLVTYVWFPFKDCTMDYDAWEEPGSPWFKNGTVNFVGQYAAGNSVLHRYAHKTEYMAHFDIDEYIVLPPRSDDVKELLSFYPEYDGIMFEETIFSVCNGTRITKDMLDVKRSQCYKTRPAKCNQYMGTCSHYKSIMKTETVLQFFAHYPTHTKSGEEVNNKLLDKKEGFHLVHFRKRDFFSYDSPNYEGVAITDFTTKSELLKDWDEYLKEKISSHFKKVRSFPAPRKLATRAPSFYYLSSTKGRDSNLGTSASQAWETWDRLVEHVNENGLEPGDRVLFRRGDTFLATSPLYLPLDRCHGTKERPVFIGGRGGEATIVAHNTSAIVLYSKNFFTGVDGNIHIAYLNIKGNAEGKYVHGITVWQENPKPISGIRIDRVKVQNFAGDGIHVERSSRFSGRVKNLVISNCEAMNNLGVPGAELPTGSGIMVAGGENVVIKRCRAGFNGARNDYKDGPVGIWITDCLDSIIRDSVSHDNLSGLNDGGGFDLDGACERCTIERCLSFNNAGPGFLLAQFKHASRIGPLRNNIIRYSMSIDDGRSGGQGSFLFWGAREGDEYASEGDVVGESLIHNCVAINSRAPLNSMGSNVAVWSRPNGVVFRDCLFVTGGGQPLIHSKSLHTLRQENLRFESCGWVTAPGDPWWMILGDRSIVGMDAWEAVGLSINGFEAPNPWSLPIKLDVVRKRSKNLSQFDILDVLVPPRGFVKGTSLYVEKRKSSPSPGVSMTSNNTVGTKKVAPLLGPDDVIIVTGGCHNVGRHLLETIQRGYSHMSGPISVVVLDSAEPIKGWSSSFNSSLYNLHENVSVVQVSVDIRDYEDLHTALSRYALRIRGIIHLAAMSRVRDCLSAPLKCVDVNVRGTENIMRALSAIYGNVRGSVNKQVLPWVLFASSREVYGALGSQDVVDESSPLQPVNLYGKTKLKAERALKQWTLETKFKVVALRFTNIYGSCYDHTSRLIPKFVSSLLAGEEIKIFGHDAKIVSLLHVEDAVQAILLGVQFAMSLDVASGTYEAFNIGGGPNHDVLCIRDILDLIKSSVPNCTSCHKVPTIVDFNSTSGGTEPEYFRASIEKASRILGYKPTRTFTTEVLHDYIKTCGLVQSGSRGSAALRAWAITDSTEQKPLTDKDTSAEESQVVIQRMCIVAFFLFVSYFGCRYCNQHQKRISRKLDLLRWAAAISMTIGLISFQACGIYSMSGPFEGETVDEGRSKSLPPPRIQLKILVWLSFMLFSASLSVFLWSFVKPRKLRKKEDAMKDRKHDRLLFIDGLRGLLALSVVIFHLCQVFIPAFPSERLGGSVVAFFVLSGFVIAYSTQRFQITPQFVLRFIICRAIRLDPPYYVSILATFCHAAFKHPGGFRYAYWGYGEWKGILVNMMYLQDFKMFGSTNIVSQSWTLCLEVQFYLFFLISVGTAQFLSSKFNSKEAMTEAGQLATGWSVLMVFGSSILVSIIHQYCSFGEKNHFLKHWFHFGMGVLVFSAMKKTIDERWLHGFLAMIILASFVTVDASGMTTALSALCLHLAVRKGKLKLWLTQWWFQFVGRISYSLYLSHGFSIIVAGIMLDNDLAGIMLKNDPKKSENWMRQADPTWVFPVHMIMCILIAWCIYWLFEYPCITIVAQLKSVFFVNDDDDSMARMSVQLENGTTRQETAICRHGHLPERVNKTEKMT